MKCDQCLSEMHPGARRCQACGSLIPKARRDRTIAIVLAGVLVLVIAGLIAVFYMMNREDLREKEFIRETDRAMERFHDATHPRP